MKVNILIIGILFGLLLLYAILTFVYLYKLPKVKFHNNESEFNLADFKTRDLIKEDKKN